MTYISNKTLPELHKEFVDACKYQKNASPVTIRGYEAVFQLFMDILGEPNLGMLTPELLTEFFKRLQTRTRIVGKNQTRQGIKTSTVATYRSKLNTFFESLVKGGHIPKNPFHDIDYPDPNYDDVKFMKKEIVEKLFVAVGFSIPWENNFVKQRNMAMCQILLTCGLRKNELLGLKVLDVDLVRKLLTVRAETSKSRRERILPLNSVAMNALIGYLDERKKLGRQTPYLWASSIHDSQFTDAGLKHLHEKLMKFTGIDFNWHQFRHTFAVNFLLQTGDIAKLKQLLGHRDVRMTIRYLRCLPTDHMRSDVERVRLDNLV